MNPELQMLQAQLFELNRALRDPDLHSLQRSRILNLIDERDRINDQITSLRNRLGGHASQLQSSNRTLNTHYEGACRVLPITGLCTNDTDILGEPWDYEMMASPKQRLFQISGGHCLSYKDWVGLKYHQMKDGKSFVQHPWNRDEEIDCPAGSFTWVEDDETNGIDPDENPLGWNQTSPWGVYLNEQRVKQILKGIALRFATREQPQDFTEPHSEISGGNTIWTFESDPDVSSPLTIDANDYQSLLNVFEVDTNTFLDWDPDDNPYDYDPLSKLYQFYDDQTRRLHSLSMRLYPEDHIEFSIWDPVRHRDSSHAASS